MHATPIPTIVQTHAQETAFLRDVRSVLVRAPHVDLLLLGREDERLAAHLDGLVVAGETGLALAREEHAAEPGVGSVFALAAWTLHAGQADSGVQSALWAEWLALAEADASAYRGLASALGWASAPQLRGLLPWLQAQPGAAAQALVLDTYRMHGLAVPAALVTAGIQADDARLRRAAWLAGGATAALPAAELSDRANAARADAHTAICAAWAACLSGASGGSGGAGAHWPTLATSSHLPAWRLALALAPLDGARDALRQPGNPPRRMAQGLAALGDLRAVPWLIERMADPTLARVAGEAFEWLTGAQMMRDGLEQLEPPPGPQAAPAMAADAAAQTAADASEATEAEDVSDLAADEDSDLPWPHQAAVAAWWAQHRATIEARVASNPSLLGQPLGVAVCDAALREGTQRLRAHAAALRVALQPGSQLLPVAAPAWRQRRWLGLARHG